MGGKRGPPSVRRICCVILASRVLLARRVMLWADCHP